MQYGVYTRKLTEAEAREGLSHVEHAPAMLQEYIGKRADLRVVCVGRDRIFPIEILSQNGSFSTEDCRFHIKELEHRLADYPELVLPIRSYMDRMQLNFACFDFAVSASSGKPIFLEANPNGQWLWMERKTGVPIAKSIAEVLAQNILHHSTNKGGTGA